MPKVTDITTHPDFQARLDPEDPNYERNQYLRDWDAGHLHHTVREDVMETMLPEGSPILSEYPLLTVEDVEASLPKDLQEPKMREPELERGPSICRNCEHVVDRRNRLSQFFFPLDAGVKDLVCSAFPRRVARNPITGREEYFRGPEEYRLRGCRGTALQVEGSRAPCTIMNEKGTCERYVSFGWKL